MPIPNAPTNLTASNASGNDINLSWTDNSSDETSFKIERKLGVSGTYSQIDTTATNVNTYADSSAKTANRPYIYRVRASNASGDSAYTNEAGATTPFTGAINNYKTDTANYAEGPTTMPLPLAGGKFYDETFGSQIMRFTGESDGSLSFVTAYSVWPTFNSNNTKVYMMSVGGDRYIGTLDPSTFTRTGSLVTYPFPSSSIYVDYESAFWSFGDPDKQFITSDAKIYYYKPSTNSFTLVKDLTSSFPAGTFFKQLYVSRDDNRFAALTKSLSTGNVGFMVYELSTDTVKLDVRTTDMNGITMDKNGDWVIYVPDSTGSTLQYVYSVNTGTSDSIVSDIGTGLPDYTVGHNDMGRNFMIGGDQWRGGLTARALSSPHNVTSAWVYAPYWINWHVSLRADNDKWALFSTYGDVVVSSDPAKYRRELFFVGVQPPYTGQLRRVAHCRSNFDFWGARTVSNATNASPIVLTLDAGSPTLQTGQKLVVSGVTGNTAANGTWFITVTDSTHISLDGSTGNGAYISGGSAYLETYWDTPRANISRDGTLIAFTSNWNGIPGGGRTDLFLAKVTAPPEGSTTLPVKLIALSM